MSKVSGTETGDEDGRSFGTVVAPLMRSGSSRSDFCWGDENATLATPSAAEADVDAGTERLQSQDDVLPGVVEVLDSQTARAEQIFKLTDAAVHDDDDDCHLVRVPTGEAARGFPEGVKDNFPNRMRSRDRSNLRGRQSVHVTAPMKMAGFNHAVPSVRTVGR